jgi:hypothetical protein
MFDISASGTQRIISGSFSWVNEVAMADLKVPYATLEIQTDLWNHSSKGDPETNYTGSVLDHGTSWSYSYYDTSFLNDSDIEGKVHFRDYTVGSWSPSSSFAPNKTYSFYITTESGLLPANLAAFSAQLGTFVDWMPLGGCYIWPEQCVFPIFGDTYYYTQLLPNGGHPSDGTRFSVVAPTTFVPFTFPTPDCELIPPGLPELTKALEQVGPPEALILGSQMLAVQNGFNRGGRRAGLGCATTRMHEDLTWWPAGGKIQDFQGSKGKGAIMLRKRSDGSWTDTAYWIRGPIWNRYETAGGPAQSALGAPVADQALAPNSAASGVQSEFADFESGAIYAWTTGAYQGSAFMLRPGILAKWRNFGGPAFRIGLPTGEENSATSQQGTVGVVQRFENGYIYWYSNTSYYVVGAIADKYRTLNTHTSALGFPTSDEYPWSGGARSDFQGGYIYWTAAAGATAYFTAPAETITAPGAPSGPNSGSAGSFYAFGLS